MSIPGSLTPLFSTGSSAAAAPVQIERSLRFNSADSAYLSRTPAVAGNRTKWTWAGWIKRSKLGVLQRFFTGATATNDDDWTAILFNASDQLVIGGYNIFFRTSNSVYRDCSAWYHLVVLADLGNGTNSLKLRAWINNEEVTWSSTSSNPTTTGINSANNHAIGAEQSPNNGGVGSYFNGYLADIHFIDGQALTPSSFTEVSATTGQLVPLAYSGSYGNNGFKLKFSDNSAATAATLGADTSGNGNNWTPNNLSVTAGAGNDSLVDTPTSGSTADTGLGGQVTGNYCTWNPLDKGPNITFANGNLALTNTTSWSTARATLGLTSGKWYFEYTLSGPSYTELGVGRSTVSLTTYADASSNAWVYYSNNGYTYNGGSGTAGAATYTTGDVIGVAFDLDSGKIWWAKNGTWLNSGNPGAGTNAAYTNLTSGDTYFPLISVDGTAGTASGDVNFGQRVFAYSNNRSGFKAICDSNLPAPLTAKPNTLMDVALYTGNGGTQSITGLAFSPDLVWIKCRTASVYHALFDVVRGVNKRLGSNETSAEQDQAPSGLSAFDSSGFTVVDGATGGNGINGSPGGLYAGSAAQYVAWAWDAGTSTVSNGSGSITSQVRANVSAGFSIVKYPNVGSTNSTIGHGLGVAPKLVIVRYINQVSGWYTYHADTGAGKYLELQSTNSAATLSSMWNNTAPTSTVFSVGTAWTSSIDTLAYCFAPVVGYSSFGSYTGNGSTDGPFVYTGFRPRWLLVKNATNGGSWVLHDTTRSTYNVSGQELLPDLSGAEYTFTRFDFLSNGFKGRTTNNASNTSSDTYIFAAFAESPFSYSRAR